MVWKLLCAKIKMTLKNNKKALSPVVATILLVLLTFSAVVIVAKFIVPLITKNLDSGSECFSFPDYFYFEKEFGYNCYQSRDGVWLTAVSVGAATVEEEDSSQIIGFQLGFTKEGDSIGVEVKEGQAVSNGEGGIRMLDNSMTTIEVPKSGEVRTYIYSSSLLYSNVNVYPILKSGRVCDKTDTIKIQGEICGDDRIIP